MLLSMKFILNFLSRRQKYYWTNILLKECFKCSLDIYHNDEKNTMACFFLLEVTKQKLVHLHPLHNLLPFSSYTFLIQVDQDLFAYLVYVFEHHDVFLIFWMDVDCNEILVCVLLFVVLVFYGNFLVVVCLV